MPPNFVKLMQNPQACEQLRLWYESQPKQFQRGPNAIIGRFLGGELEDTKDFSALQTRFDSLFGRLKPDQQRSILARAIEEPDLVSDSPDGTIRAGAVDIFGDVQSILLNGHINGNPVSLAGSSLFHTGSNGISYFRDPETGDKIVVFNVTGDADTLEGAVLGGRLPARHAVNALFPQTLFPDKLGDRVTLLSNISVTNVSGFDSNSTYAGYRVKSLPRDLWVPLWDIVIVEGSAIRDGDGEQIRLLSNDGTTTSFPATFLKKLLAGLRETHYGYRRIGAVTNLFDGAYVNLETGELVVEPGTETYLMDAELIAPEGEEATDLHSEVEDYLFKLEDEFFPGFAPRILANEHLGATAEYHLKRFGEKKVSILDSLTTAEVVNKLIHDLGIAEAAKRILSSENVGPHERAAFLDYLTGFMDNKVWRWIRAGGFTTDAGSMLRRASSMRQMKASMEVLLQSLRVVFDISALPTAVGVDDVAMRAYEDIRDVIGESLYNEDDLSMWYDLLTVFYAKHGLAQIDMFFAKEIPLALLRSAVDPFGRPFFEFAVDRINSLHRNSGDGVNGGREILSWESFGDDVRNLTSPGDGTDGPQHSIITDSLNEALHRTSRPVWNGLQLVDIAAIHPTLASAAVFRPVG